MLQISKEMDTNDRVKTLDKSSSAEEIILATKDYAPEIITYNETAERSKENTCEEINVASAKLKNPIEILNVELFAPRWEDHLDVDNSNDEVLNKNEENIPPVEKVFTEISDIDVEGNTVEIQTNKETESQDNEMETNNAENEQSVNVTIVNSMELLGSTQTNSLSLLAQYQSDDDSDSVIEIPTSSDQDYRTQVVVIDSDGDSDDSSDSSSVEYLTELRKTIEKHIEVADDNVEDDDNEDDTGKKRHQTSSKLRVKGEMLLEDLPPIQELQITVPENECIEFGKIHSVVDQLILVSALPNVILLDLETVMFLEKGQKVLGEVFDVLGQVADPLYCVRFNSNEEIKEKQINIGDVVYVAPKTQYTQYVILSNLMRLKGSDASWENDVEPPPKFLDYSDDEQEQQAKRQSRNKDRPIDDEDPSKKPKTADAGEGSASNRFNNSNTHKNQHNEQRNSRFGTPGYSNATTRPRYNGPPQNQQRAPNHHRSSWHSNYYPQYLPSHPTGSYEIRVPLNQPHSSNAYPPHISAYTMPPVQNMPYSPTQYGAPAPQYSSPQVMPNTYSIRPPTLHGPPSHVSHHHQYSSNPPPPPGSQ